jgi:hypothetical protein
MIGGMTMGARSWRRSGEGGKWCLTLLALFANLNGCTGDGTQALQSYDASPSFIQIRAIKSTVRHEKISWESDDSPKPATISIRLGDKEMREVQQLNPNRDIALKLYIEPRIRHLKLCGAGFEIRPGQRTGSKRGDYGFLLQCFWNDK